MKRYKQISYDTRIELVECPKCKKEAVVENKCQGHQTMLGHTYYCNRDFVFKCYHCMYSCTPSDCRLYRVSVKRNCPECGKEIFVQRDGLKQALDELEVTCPHCQFTAQYKVTASTYVPCTQPSGLAYNHVFGFPFWLQTSVKGHLIWARNREHLQAIRAYVEADLRERQTPYLMSMVARLPTFIKTAKNRDDVLKAIDRMLKR